jgi:hypothetical protein
VYPNQSANFFVPGCCSVEFARAIARRLAQNARVFRAQANSLIIKQAVIEFPHDW